MKSSIQLLAALLILSLVACHPDQDNHQLTASTRSTKLQVYVDNYPLCYFAERIGKGAVEVNFPAPADEDPAFWQPDDATILAYQGADLILMNGASYAKWAEKVTLPQSKLVDTSATFKSKYIEVRDDTTHSHGPGGEHSHSGIAFTTWIDLQQAIHQAEAVAKALKTWVPDAEKNLDGLKAELESLDQRLLAVGKRAAGVPVVASHPVYHYLARRYSLNMQSVLWEPETVPDEKAMDELKSILTKHPAKWMIWEGQPAKESVAMLDALGVSSLVFDPCGNVPDSGDFMTVMKANVEALEKAFP
ncbi:MAG: metal ABC transporter substrate-binding protein [Prosthecobacter sp.]|jgi:zinc transport system substrate-binding protein|nr:metal ABC transporter substrate-binding protein [Prosthecobacter sp.]